MDLRSMVEALCLKQEEVAPRLEPTYYVVVRYNSHTREWEVCRYDEEGIEIDYQTHALQGAARYVAETWMDKFNVTRVYIYQMNGKVKDVVFNGVKE
jgi:hypothetical protein